MTRKTMRKPTSTKALVTEHLRASKEVFDRATRTKSAAQAYLRDAGFLTKSGRLASPYRPK